MSTAQSTLDPFAILPRGVALTVWSGGGLVRAYDTAKELLAATQPQMVQLHGGLQEVVDHASPLADGVRRLIPNAVIVVGLQWDGWIGNYAAAGAGQKASIEALYLRAITAAQRAGAVMWVIDNEASGVRYAAASRMIGARIIDAGRAACPNMLVGHTSYDHPHYHPEEVGNGGRIDADDEGYPWSVYLAGAAAEAVDGLVLPKTGRVDVEMEQIYAAPAKPADGPTPMADRLALAKRVASSAASFRRAEALGWIDPAVPHLPYVQCHHCPSLSIAGVGATMPRVAMWASSLIDADGRIGLDVLARAARGTLTLAGASNAEAAAILAWAQGKLGVDYDAKWGPMSEAACRTWQTTHGLAATGGVNDETLHAMSMA